MPIENDDFRNEFLAQFHEAAVERLGACKTQLDKAGDEAGGRVEMVRARAEILRELHAFKGEARMMGAEQAAGPIECAEKYIKDRSVPLSAMERRLLLRTFDAVEKLVGHMAGLEPHAPTVELNALLKMLTRAADDAKPDPDRTARLRPEVTAAAEAAARAAIGGATGNPDLRQHVDIVLIDDSEIVRVMVVSTLQNAGYPARGVENIDDLRAACAAKRPSLILCDYHLGPITGADVIRELAGEVTTAGIPVVIFSGMEPHELARTAESAGAAGYMPKPDDMAQWLQVLDIMADQFRRFQ